MHWCIVLGCSNHVKKLKTESPEKKITYHRFPKDVRKQRLWVKAIGRDKSWVPTRNHRICSEHFEEECFKRDSETYTLLKQGSVPTIFQGRAALLLESARMKDQNSESNKKKPKVQNSKESNSSDQSSSILEALSLTKSPSSSNTPEVKTGDSNIAVNSNGVNSFVLDDYGQRIHVPDYIDQLTYPRNRVCEVCALSVQAREVCTYCPDCPGEPALCIQPCFRAFHDY